MARKTRNTINRNIYFYRLHVGTQECGEPVDFDAPTVFAQLQQKILKANGCAYVGLPGTTDVLRCAVDNIQNGAVCLRIGKVRRENLPKQELEGAVSDLHLPDGAGLLEDAHVIFFDENLVGFEFNFHAPRISGIDKVLKTLLPEVRFDQFEFRQLISEDALQKLDSLGELTLFHLRLAPAYATQIKPVARHLAGTFESAIQAGATGDVEIILRRPKEKEAFLSQTLKDTAKTLLRLPEFFQNARTFKVQAVNKSSNRLEGLNLLEDKFIASTKIVKSGERSKAVLSDDAYRVIKQAFEERREKLRKAPALGGM